MSVVIEAMNGGVVMAPIGQINSGNAGSVETQVLGSVAQGNHRVILDLAQLSYISSAGLRVVLMLAKHIKQVSGRLVLSGMQPQVREVFDISGFLAILTVVDNRQAAMDLMSTYDE